MSAGRDLSTKVGAMGFCRDKDFEQVCIVETKLLTGRSLRVSNSVLFARKTLASRTTFIKPAPPLCHFVVIIG